MRAQVGQASRKLGCAAMLLKLCAEAEEERQVVVEYSRRGIQLRKYMLMGSDIWIRGYMLMGSDIG